MGTIFLGAQFSNPDTKKYNAQKGKLDFQILSDVCIDDDPTIEMQQCKVHFAHELAGLSLQVCCTCTNATYLRVRHTQHVSMAQLV